MSEVTSLDHIRDDFPVLRDNEGLVYLDSAATSLKPQSVADAVTWFMTEGTASVHRGVYRRTVEVSERFEEARSTVAEWFDVDDTQVVFTRGVTDGINLVRRSLPQLSRVVTSVAEHHSNLLPWRTVEDIRVLECDSTGVIAPDQLADQLSRCPAELVALAHVGNVSGAIQPAKELSDVAHKHGALFLLDAAQSSWHLPCGPSETGADFVVCSSHKMLGPSGVGALIGTVEALDQLSTESWGGGMVESVDLNDCRLQPVPQRFEAGTPAVESILGFAAAIEYLDRLGQARIEKLAADTSAYLFQRLQEFEDVQLVGPTDSSIRGGVAAMLMGKVESHVAAKILSQRAGICVRSGFHCAEPLHRHLGLTPTLRASAHVYTTRGDIDRFIDELMQIPRVG